MILRLLYAAASKLSSAMKKFFILVYDLTNCICRSSNLRSLGIPLCNPMRPSGLVKAVAKLPLLEELEIPVLVENEFESYRPFLSTAKDIEA